VLRFIETKLFVEEYLTNDEYSELQYFFNVESRQRSRNSWDRWSEKAEVARRWPR